MMSMTSRINKMTMAKIIIEKSMLNQKRNNLRLFIHFYHQNLSNYS